MPEESGQPVAAGRAGGHGDLEGGVPALRAGRGRNCKDNKGNLVGIFIGVRPLWAQGSDPFQNFGSFQILAGISC